MISANGFLNKTSLNLIRRRYTRFVPLKKIWKKTEKK